MPLLSIVIAAHNAGSYLGATLDRLAGELTHASDAVEVLLLDDASTDDTGAIARSYAGRHAWLRPVRVEHRNVGRVRQSGIDAAQGRYVAFLDSDDAFMDGAIAWLLDLLRRDAPDVLLAPLRETAEPTYAETITPHLSVRPLDAHQAVGLFLEHRSIQGHLIGKCFARSLLVQHPVPPLAAYEDMAVLPALLLASRRTVLADGPFYLYLKRPGSLSCRQGWPRLGEHVAALETIGRDLAPHVPAHRLGAFWVDLADAVSASPDGAALLRDHPAIDKHVAAVPLLRFLLDPRIRTSLKRKLLGLRAKAAR